MKNVLISYDLNAENPSYDDVIQTIRSFGQTVHVLKSVWLVKSNLDIGKMLDRLEPFLGKRDDIFIIEIKNQSIAILDPLVMNAVNHLLQR